MRPLPIPRIRHRQLLRLLLVLLPLDLLSLFERDDVFPAQIVLHVGDVGELGHEGFAAEGGSAVGAFGHRFVVFGAVEDVVEVHLV